MNKLQEATELFLELIHEKKMGAGLAIYTVSEHFGITKNELIKYMGQKRTPKEKDEFYKALVN